MAESPTPVSASALIRPCLVKIKDNVAGRKHVKLQEDLDSLLEKLDIFLNSAAASTPRLRPQHQPTIDGAELTTTSQDVTADTDTTPTTPAPSSPPPPSHHPHHPNNSKTVDSAHIPASPPGGSRRPGALPDGAAREMMLVLRDAVDTRKPIVMEVALDCLQKLVSFKLIQGPVHSINHKRGMGLGTSSTATTITGNGDSKKDEADDVVPLQFAAQPPQAQAVELMCRCDDTGDEAVELRLLKALLTVTTSPHLPVHGQALLLTVRACYNVFLTSRSEVTQVTAKATLTQMLNVVFQRLEVGTLAVVVPPMAVADVLGLPPADASSMSAFVQQFLLDVASSMDPFGTMAEGVQAELDEAFVHHHHHHQSMEASGPAVEELYDASDPVDAQRISWRGQGEEEGGREGEHEKEVAVTTTTTTVAVEEDVVFSANPNPTPPLPHPPSSSSSLDKQQQHQQQQQQQANQLSAVLQKDAFLVFRALCKLSIRSADASSAAEATTMRGKVLALELLKVLLENSGPTFRNGDRFIGAIKQYLCLSLLKNCASSSVPAQRLCASIFLTLITHFRRDLKAEIGVFYPMIFLRPIEPPAGGSGGGMGGGGGGGGGGLAGLPSSVPSSSFPQPDTAQKAVALRCLHALCSDGQILVDLFVNYDCDLGGANLFERTITALVRVAQGSHPPAGTAEAAETQALRYEALRCLASALDSLKVWYDQQMEAAGGRGLRNPKKKKTDDSVEEGSAHAAAGQPSSSVPTTVTTTPSPEISTVEDSLKETWMQRLASGSGTGPMPMPPAIGSTENGEVGGRDATPSEADLLRSWKAFKRAFEQGVAEFNKKPKKGIAYLQNQGLLGPSPQDVAHFLSSTRGLNKTLVGDFLGERDDFHLKVMHAYVDAMEFTALDFDAAIRKFLSGFRLPGEAQKIDRLMEKFAERYVSCNQDAFKSADVAYVLAYSVIMLNTDAHNPGVKNKMSKSDFMRNNRGINDGGDLPPDFMGALYDRIVNDEIKMKDEDTGHEVGGSKEAAAAAEQQGWLDTMMSIFPGRQRAAAAEPTEAAIRRTHEFLREQAKGAKFYEAKDSEAVRPMIDVAWAPTLGALSVLFEGEDNDFFVAQCLGGFEAAIGLTSRLNMTMLQSTFISSLARFTTVHAPSRMRVKHALAFRALLHVADAEGNSLGDMWGEVLRCVSRFELLVQLDSGGAADAVLFVMSSPSPANTPTHLTVESYSSINDMGLQATVKPGPGSKAHSGGAHDPALPPPGVLAAVDPQELNRFFVDSVRLESDAVVEFVSTLCAVSREELTPGAGPPRVFSLGKIVEIAHFNMGRIRLVWSRIWAVLSDFFAAVGCHENLAVALYAVDSLRQLAMKFLERDELANYTFQNDFLRPFVSLVRNSKSAEIRELVIRCVSQMVLGRVANIKSGWKSVFMVFTTAAGDESPHIVRLAFDTVEKIVRDHFRHITETETTTFTDCVNCLVAFTNNPHSLDVSLNSIAFLRFCAMELAEGDIGELGLPEGAGAGAALDPNAHRIRPRVGPAEAEAAAKAVSAAAAAAAATVSAAAGASTGTTASTGPTSLGIRFTDKDEHMYFWFPLLAGLSELTFDPRQEIRYGAMGVLFDILKYHGGSFTPEFWIRVYDSVLLPMFDHVRAEVTDTTTFTDEVRRAEVDAWLYETCTATLQHMVDVVSRYYTAVPALLTKTLDLLGSLIRRPHASLAAVGVAALTRLALACGETADVGTWEEVAAAFRSAAEDTLPAVAELIQHRMTVRGNGGTWSLGTGAGARRMAEVKVRASTQLLLAQACGEVYAAHARTRLPIAAAITLLDVLQSIAQHATRVDADVGLRHSLSVAQAADGVGGDRGIVDPPLLRLEVEAAQAYLSVLLTLTAVGPESVKRKSQADVRLVELCLHNLDRYEQQSLSASAAAEAAAGAGFGSGHEHGHDGVNGGGEGQGDALRMTSAVALALASENEALSPLAVATLKALMTFPPDMFKSRIKDFFPLLTSLISCETAPPEVQRILSEVFAHRVGNLME